MRCLGRRAGRRGSARGLPHLGRHGDGQAGDLTDGFFDVCTARAAREGIDHRFDREEQDDGGAVDGSELCVAADHRPCHAADGGQAFHDLVPASAQHVGLASAGGVDSGSLAARTLLVGYLAARRFVAAHVGAFPRRPLRGGLGPPGAFGAGLRGGFGTALLAHGLAARVLCRSALALARAFLLVGAFVTPPLALAVRGALASPTGRMVVQGTFTREPPGSIACGRFVARPSWALLRRAMRGFNGGFGRTLCGAGRTPIGAAPPRGHALRGGCGCGRGGCGCLPGGSRGLGALLLLPGQGLACLASAETTRGGLGRRSGGHLARRSPTGHADGALHGAGGGRGGGSWHEDAPDEELELQAGRGRARHGTQGLVGQVGGAGQAVRAPVLRLALHALELVVRGVRQDVARAVAGHRDDEEVAQALEEILNEAARVVAGLDHALDDTEGRGAVATREGVDALVEQRGIRVPE